MSKRSGYRLQARISVEPSQVTSPTSWFASCAGGIVAFAATEWAKLEAGTYRKSDAKNG
jgi:hypothetical protein